MRSLRSLGLPSEVCRLVDMLYWGHGCKISIGGALHDGFPIRAGIRQGCPLSPLLFAVVVDPLLRRLCRVLPGGMVRAYVDDVATVVPDLWAASDVLAPLFALFGACSGLHLNLRKVVLVPLGDQPPAAVRDARAFRRPTWAAIAVRDWAEYLGFVLGPGRTERSWAKVSDKVLRRAALWGVLELGLRFAAIVYNVYILSMLGFLLQLDVLPCSWPQTEAKAFRLLVRGPGQWAIPEDFRFLKRCFGLLGRIRRCKRALPRSEVPGRTS